MCSIDQIILGVSECAPCPLIPRGIPVTEIEDEYRSRVGTQYVDSQTSDRNRGKAYCGSNPAIVEATLFHQCYAGDGLRNPDAHFSEDATEVREFQNPFKYSRVSSRGECFIKGKLLSNSMQSDSRRSVQNARDQDEKEEEEEESDATEVQLPESAPLRRSARIAQMANFRRQD